MRADLDDLIAIGRHGSGAVVERLWAARGLAPAVDGTRTHRQQGFVPATESTNRPTDRRAKRNRSTKRRTIRTNQRTGVLQEATPVGYDLGGRARAPAILLQRAAHASTMLGKSIMNGSNKLRSVVFGSFRVAAGARNMLMQAITNMSIKRHIQ